MADPIKTSERRTKEELVAKLLDYARDARGYAVEGGEYYSELAATLSDAAKRIAADPWSDVR